MSPAQRRYRAAVLACAALTGGSVLYAVGASGTPNNPLPASSCRASLLQASIDGQPIPEIAAANGETADGAPCVEDDASVVGEISLQPDLPVTADVLYARTNTTPGEQAESGVARLDIPLSQLNPGLPNITAGVLTSEAGVRCNGTNLVATGASQVVDLEVSGVGGIELPPPDETGSNYFDLNLDPIPVRIQFNEQTTETANGKTTLTQRALHINALDGVVPIEVIVAESKVDWTGDPCAPTTTTTTTGTPTTGTPTTGTPTTGTPTTGQPTTGQPTTGQPTTGQPTTGQPTTGQPTTGQPTTGQPTTGGTGGPPVVGWMTGGGTIAGTKITHGFVLPCTLTQKAPGPNLTIHIPGQGTVKLTELETVSCSDAPGVDPENPSAGFDTITGTGTGTCKGEEVDIEFTFQDGGEPAAGRDTSDIEVTGACTADAAGVTQKGNHQAHKGNNPPA